MSSSAAARSVIALCESSAQVARLAGDSAIAGDVTTWVSANPAAAWALERRRLPFVPLENFDDGSLREHVEPRIAEQIAWAEGLDETLQREVPDFRSANFRPTRHSLYHIKNFWDTIVHRGTMLTRLAGELKPTRVYHFANTVPLHLGSDVRGLVG